VQISRTGSIRNGAVTALAVTSGRRAAALPEIPTMSEAGLPDYAASGYTGIMATGGTPRDVVEKINAAINAVVREPEFSSHFAALGYEMTGGTVDEFAAFIKNDTARYAALMRAIGMAIE
jgi:tripartite-type tricarboxylate transporter receptor subunit TctC